MFKRNLPEAAAGSARSRAPPPASPTVPSTLLPLKPSAGVKGQLRNCCFYEYLSENVQDFSTKLLFLGGETVDAGSSFSGTLLLSLKREKKSPSLAGCLCAEGLSEVRGMIS